MWHGRNRIPQRKQSDFSTGLILAGATSLIPAPPFFKFYYGNKTNLMELVGLVSQDSYSVNCKWTRQLLSVRTAWEIDVVFQDIAA